MAITTMTAICIFPLFCMRSILFWCDYYQYLLRLSIVIFQGTLSSLDKHWVNGIILNCIFVILLSVICCL